MSITTELREWARDNTVQGVVLTTHPAQHPVHGTLESLLAIADRIDAEHQKALDEWKAKHGQMWLKGYSECHAELLEGNETLASDLERCGWVRLPVDADGVPIHVGDVVTMQLLFGGESKPLVVDRMELSHGRDGDLWCVALDTDKECWNQPSLMRHYTPPTVEDVLREFASDIADVLGGDDFRLEDNDELFAEYAAKLRLAGEGE